MANPEVVVRDCDTDARAFGLPSNRIRGYDDLLERSFVGLQKNARLFDAHFHLQNNECDNIVEERRWDAGEYFAGRGKRLAVCVHFVPKARAERERPQLNAEAEVIEISSGSEEAELKRHPAPDVRLPEGYGRPAAPGAVALPTSGQFTNCQGRRATFKSNKRGHLVSFKPPARQDAPIIETSRQQDYGHPAPSSRPNFPIAEDHRPEGYTRSAPAARQQAPVTVTRRRREGYGRPASPLQDIHKPYKTSHPWPPPPTGRRGAPVFEFRQSSSEQRPGHVRPTAAENQASSSVIGDFAPLQPAFQEQINQGWENVDDLLRQGRDDEWQEADQRRARQTSSPLFCTPPPAALATVVPQPRRRRNIIDLSPSLVDTEEDKVPSRKLKNRISVRDVVESDDKHV
jgi:hypothetical protein